MELKGVELNKLDEIDRDYMFMRWVSTPEQFFPVLRLISDNITDKGQFCE